MSAWIVITAAHLNDYAVAALVSALRTAALAKGQVDPFTTVMHDRANYVRDRISNRTQISATPYAVPPELKTQTCWLIIEALQGRLPGINLTDIQKDMVKDAKSDLDRAGTDRLRISMPDDPITPAVQSGGATQVVSSSTRKATRESMNGL